MNSIESAIMDWTAIITRLWMHDINQFTRTSGLSFGQMNLMLHIHYRGACEVSGVSDLMQMTPAGASQMVERMVQQGLVTRNEVPGDRRIRLVHLTRQGEEMVQGCIRLHEKWVHELAETLSSDEQAEAERILMRLTEIAGRS
ncbi:MarR family winged helix-turn-helix transcriptional regulator [Leptolinea tardivitalis]|nr:MarR family winged helix-turn-helix transcriptional regulator [Leptolinea tardivitalis]